MAKKEVNNHIKVRIVIIDGRQKAIITKTILKAYKHRLLSRRTLAEICNDLDVSYPKLNKEFDKFDMSEGLLEEVLQDLNQPINLLIDATFFGREFGFLVFHDCQKVTPFQL